MYPITTLTGKLAGINPAETRMAFEPEGSYKAFFTRLGDLPGEVIKNIEEATYHIVPGTIYQVKPISLVTKIFETQDQKKTGKKTIQSAKVDTGKHFIYTKLQILVGTAASDSEEDYFNIEWKGVEAIPNVVNGEVYFDVAKETHIPELTSMEVFATGEKSNIRGGQWEIDNPKWILGDSEMKFEITLGDNSKVPPNSFIKVVFDGMWVTT